jgi:hypothetical protein
VEKEKAEKVGDWVARVMEAVEGLGLEGRDWVEEVGEDKLLRSPAEPQTPMYQMQPHTCERKQKHQVTDVPETTTISTQKLSNKQLFQTGYSHGRVPRQNQSRKLRHVGTPTLPHRGDGGVK